MTSSLLHPASVTVTSADELAASYRGDAWNAWLHGRVAAVLLEGTLHLLVPMAAPTPAAVDLARRLYAVGSVELLA